MDRHLTPFGLRHAVPSVSVVAAGPVSAPGPGVRAMYAGFDGRPLSEQAGDDDDDGADEGDTPPSSPTEPDGRDPINVDSDPFYD